MKELSALSGKIMRVPMYYFIVSAKLRPHGSECLYVRYRVGHYSSLKMRIVLLYNVYIARARVFRTGRG